MNKSNRNTNNNKIMLYYVRQNRNFKNDTAGLPGGDSTEACEDTK